MGWSGMVVFVHGWRALEVVEARAFGREPHVVLLLPLSGFEANRDSDRSDERHQGNYDEQSHGVGWIGWVARHCTQLQRRALRSLQLARRFRA